MDTADKILEERNTSKTYTTWWQFILIRMVAVVIPNICGFISFMPLLLGLFSGSFDEATLRFESINVSIRSFLLVIYLMGFIFGASYYTLTRILIKKQASVGVLAIGSQAVKYIPINIQGFRTVIKDGRSAGFGYFALWILVSFFGFVFVAIDIIQRLQGKYYEYPKAPGLTEEELNDPKTKKFRKTADIMLIVCVVFCIMVLAFPSLFFNILSVFIDSELVIGFAFVVVFFMYCLNWLPKAVKYKKAFVVTFSIVLLFVTLVTYLGLGVDAYYINKEKEYAKENISIEIEDITFIENNSKIRIDLIATNHGKLEINGYSLDIYWYDNEVEVLRTNTESSIRVVDVSIKKRKECKSTVILNINGSVPQNLGELDYKIETKGIYFGGEGIWINY